MDKQDEPTDDQRECIALRKLIRDMAKAIDRAPVAYLQQHDYDRIEIIVSGNRLIDME
jgi:hypothetical protein